MSNIVIKQFNDNNVRSIQLVGAKSETAKQGYKTEQASQGDKFGDTSIPF